MGTPQADKRNHLHVITFDPGGQTGWAHFAVHRRAFIHPRNKILRHIIFWRTGKFVGTERDQVNASQDLVRESIYGGRNLAAEYRLVSEPFELTQTAGGDDLLIPVRLNAVMEFMFWASFHIQMEYQSRSMRTNVTKERMRLWGLTPWDGKDSFAAMQHGVTFLRRLKQEANRRPWELK